MIRGPICSGFGIAYNEGVTLKHVPYDDALVWLPKSASCISSLSLFMSVSVSVSEFDDIFQQKK